MIWNTLLMRNALTNAVMKAKIEQAGAEGADERVDGLLVLVDDDLTGDHLGALRQHLLDPRHHRRRVDALVDLDVDRVIGAVGAEDRVGRRRIEGGERRAGEAVGVAETRRAW